MGEPFQNYNDDGTRDNFEPWRDFVENVSHDEANGIYNGTFCPGAAAEAGDCSRELIYLQMLIYIVMSPAGFKVEILKMVMAVPLVLSSFQVQRLGLYMRSGSKIQVKYMPTSRHRLII